MEALKELELLICSRYPIIAVETFEEERLEGALQRVAAKLGIPLFVWTITQGLRLSGSDKPIYDTQQPIKALGNLAAIKNDGIYLFKDLHRYLGEAEVIRKLQDLARSFGKDRRALVLSASRLTLPAELEKLAASFKLNLPTAEELKLLARSVVRNLSGQHKITVELSPEEFDRLVEGMRGFTLFEAERALTKAILQDLALTRKDLDLIVEIKKDLLEREGILEYSPPEDMAEVGGLQNLKRWLEKRRKAFDSEAKQFGILPPKGILLLGVQGCLRGDSRVLLADGCMPTFETLARQASDCLEPGVYEVAYRVALEDGTTAMATKLQIHANRQAVLLKFEDGRELEATPDHELLTTHGWRRAGNIAPGDDVLLWNRSHGFVTPPKRTGFGRPLHSVRKRRIPIDVLPEIWTPELAELIGLVAAEGCRDRYQIASTVGFISERKQARLERGLASFSRRTRPRNAGVARVATVETGRMLDRVFDLTVPGAGRFIANGLVVHNCGKSLAAKAVAKAWGLPFLKLEPGRLYDKYVGESEKNLDKALRMAEGMAPCVLMIDEIEKGLAYAGSSEADAGLSKRIFGRLLSWLQDRTAPVFVVATCNQISQLPPELMRKGRFDEIFFIDLPDQEERKEIFSVHLRKRKRDPSAFDLDVLAEASVEFSGAEIEQAVVSALYTAFSHGTDLSTRLLVEELTATRPLSVIRQEEIAALRQWAEGRTVMAS